MRGEQSKKYIIEKKDSGKRFDRWLTEVDDLFSRTLAQKLIKTQLATVNEQCASPAYSLRTGDRICYRLPAPVASDILPQEGNLAILFEDEELLVIDKPAGMVVHPAPGHPDHTLVNYVLHHCPHLSGIGGVQRPGIVHRIDKDTSGILVIAKTDHSHQYLSKQFQDHSIDRKYSALVWGTPTQSSGTFSTMIGRDPTSRKKFTITTQGKHAITHWKVEERFAFATFLSCELETGRTHQIRVHLSKHRLPIIGDPLYGNNKIKKNYTSVLVQALRSLNRQALHARELGFIHPTTEKKLHFRSSIPADMQAIIRALRSEK